MHDKLILITKTSGALILSSLSFVDGLDIITKIISVAIAGVVGYYAVKSYRARIKVDSISYENELKKRNEKSN